MPSARGYHHVRTYVLRPGYGTVACGRVGDEPIVPAGDGSGPMPCGRAGDRADAVAGAGLAQCPADAQETGPMPWRALELAQCPADARETRADAMAGAGVGPMPCGRAGDRAFATAGCAKVSRGEEAGGRASRDSPLGAHVPGAARPEAFAPDEHLQQGDDRRAGEEAADVRPVGHARRYRVVEGEEAVEELEHDPEAD